MASRGYSANPKAKAKGKGKGNGKAAKGKKRPPPPPASRYNWHDPAPLDYLYPWKNLSLPWIPNDSVSSS